MDAVLPERAHGPQQGLHGESGGVIPLVQVMDGMGSHLHGAAGCS